MRASFDRDNNFHDENFDIRTRITALTYQTGEINAIIEAWTHPQTKYIHAQDENLANIPNSEITIAAIKPSPVQVMHIKLHETLVY